MARDEQLGKGDTMQRLTNQGDDDVANYPFIVETNVTIARRIGKEDQRLQVLSSHTEIIECNTKQEAMHVHQDLSDKVFPEVNLLNQNQKQYREKKVA